MLLHCSAWECGETQKDVRDKESINYRPPATLGRVDYMGKRLDRADREMARMFGEDRKIQMNKSPSIISIITHIFCLKIVELYLPSFYLDVKV